MLEQVLASYGISQQAIDPYGTGLINHTWKVSSGENDYILQQVNHAVFKNPGLIAENIQAVADWLKNNHPGYFFVAPVPTREGSPMLFSPDNGYFRLFPYVKRSCTYDVAETPQLAFEAARQFGLFTRKLAGFPVENLKITLPDFHNLVLRYRQFEQAAAQGNPDKIYTAREVIGFLRSQEHLVATYQQIVFGNAFRQRVTHHDTKISNVLFDEKQQGLCVIDLDTVMPGYFISDAGDMMRTYLSPVSEEEKDFSKIVIREEYFRAIVQGYLAEMEVELTETEIGHFVYAGMFMIYMQALRFLTDYLNDDVYYGASYEGHNYTRACNQVVLLERMIEKKNSLNRIVLETAKSTRLALFAN